MLASAADGVIFSPSWVKHLDVGPIIPIPCTNISKHELEAAVNTPFAVLFSIFYSIQLKPPVLLHLFIRLFLYTNALEAAPVCGPKTGLQGKLSLLP